LWPPSMIQAPKDLTTMIEASDYVQVRKCEVSSSKEKDAPVIRMGSLICFELDLDLS